MNQKIYILIIFFLSICNLGYAEINKVVFIDMDQILQQSKAGKSINEQIKKFVDAKQNEIKKIEQEIKDEDENINAQKNILNENELNKKIKEFNIKLKKYQNKLKVNRDEITNKRISATGKLLEELKPILAEYSKNNSISLILQKKDIIIGANDLNITNDIIALVDKKVTKININ